MKIKASLIFWGILFAITLSSQGSKAYADKVIYDLPIVISRQSWGVMGENYAAHELGKEPLKLQIGDKVYDKGIGTHAKSVIELDLLGKYETFNAEIGVQHYGNTEENPASIIFKVIVDGENKFESGIMAMQSPAQKISIAVAGASEMSLIVEDAGDGINSDLANWADASLVESDEATKIVNNKSIDIIPFGRVMTWDSDLQKNEPSRIKELSVEDIFPGEEIFPVDGQFVLASDNNKYCIGGQWAENRQIRKFVIEFVEGSDIPELDKTQLQWWVGSSVWSGQWKPIFGQIEKQGNTFVYNTTIKDCRDGYYKEPNATWIWTVGFPKFRWVFEAEKTVKVKKISAYPRANWDVVELDILIDKNIARGNGRIEMYNGEITNASQDHTDYGCSWQLDKPLKLKLKNCVTKVPPLSDRTLLNITLAESSFSVSVADIIANGCVYVPDYGFFATTSDSGITLESYRKQIAGKKTILQQVREMPDQTFAQAFDKVHYDHQEGSPIMLSLACAMDKCVVQRGGAIEYFRNTATPFAGDVLSSKEDVIKITPKYGTGKNENLERHLDGGWYPIPVTTIKDQGITYQQKNFVTQYGDSKMLPVYYSPLEKEAVCVTEIILSNADSEEKTASVEIEMNSQSIDVVENGFVAVSYGKCLAYYNTSEAQKLDMKVAGNTLKISGNLQPGEIQKIAIYMPMYDYWTQKGSDNYKYLNGANGVDGFLANTKAYWDDIMAGAIQIDIADDQFENLIKASQVHCLIATRNEKSGKYLTPWISSCLYGPLESEAHSIILGMGMMGHQEYAMRALDYFIDNYNAKGYLTTGYTILGLGQHLWTLADYYKLYLDKGWLRANASEIKRACDWILTQIEKTHKLDSNGNKLPEYGLFPPGVSADWSRFAYRTQLQAHFGAGLKGAAQCLEDIDYPGYAKILKQSLEFKQNIRRAYKWSTSKSPVIKLQNDTWITYSPTFLYAFGFMDDIYPGEDWNRSWAYDSELGANHLAAAGILEINDPEVDNIRNCAEDIQFMRDGLNGTYPAEQVAKDTFNLAGFGKCQNYYGRFAEIHAAKDDIKPFIRSYYNAVCSIVCKEVMSLWEHTPATSPHDAFNKTHETGWFLYHTRIMLVNERDDELWLAPFVTNNWQKEGMVVEVKNAPTNYGKVSYKIISNVDKGYIDAEITPPDRSKPKYLVIRLRHPQEKKMVKVQVNGKPYRDFDPDKEIVKLKIKGSKTISVRAFYNH